jgi:hypothetical protein
MYAVIAAAATDKLASTTTRAMTSGAEIASASEHQAKVALP